MSPHRQYNPPPPHTCPPGSPPLFCKQRQGLEQLRKQHRVWVGQDRCLRPTFWHTLCAGTIPQSEPFRCCIRHHFTQSKCTAKQTSPGPICKSGQCTAKSGTRIPMVQKMWKQRQAFPGQGAVCQWRGVECHNPPTGWYPNQRVWLGTLWLHNRIGCGTAFHGAPLLGAGGDAMEGGDPNAGI